MNVLTSNEVSQPSVTIQNTKTVIKNVVKTKSS